MDRRYVGVIVYSKQEGAKSSFENPSIQILAPDDYRFWRFENPETKNIISLLPISVQFELCCRQQFVSGFNLVDITPPSIVFPKEYSITCKPLTQQELFFLNEFYGNGGEQYLPKYSDPKIANFISKIASARFQFCLTQLERQGTVMSMFNQADLTDFLVFQNVRESPLDAELDYNVFSTFKRIRHRIFNEVVEFQTDSYLEKYGTNVGIFYDIGSNDNHTKIRMVTTTKLNMIANKYNNIVRGTFLHLPNNHKNRHRIKIDGHYGHKVTRSIAAPRPVMVEGSSIWDVTNIDSPCPVYPKSTPSIKKKLFKGTVS